MRMGLVTVGVMAMVGSSAVGCAAPLAHSASDPQAAREPRSTALLSAAISDPAESGEAKPEPEPEALPTSCDGEQAIKNTKACIPAAAFAKKLCGGIYPEVALTMFAKGTPWKRVWLAGDVEAWNASGGRTHRATLAFDEEVIVLSRHGAASSGGIVMTGAMASFDVLRWDGTCVSVMEGELTTRRPPVPKPASVPWTRLEETTRRALLTSPKVKASHDAFDKTCGGGDKKACAKADRAFANAVADFVRAGGPLPTPTRRP